MRCPRPRGRVREYTCMALCEHMRICLCVCAFVWMLTQQPEAEGKTFVKKLNLQSKRFPKQFAYRKFCKYPLVCAAKDETGSVSTF